MKVTLKEMREHQSNLAPEIYDTAPVAWGALAVAEKGCYYIPMGIGLTAFEAAGLLAKNGGLPADVRLFHAYPVHQFKRPDPNGPLQVLDVTLDVKTLPIVFTRSEVIAAGSLQ